MLRDESEIRGADMPGLAEREDLSQITMWLDLTVVAEPGAGERCLKDAARLWLEPSDSESSEVNTIDITLSIDVDIYSPVTWGEERDNRTLATINGPRLARFLRALRDQLNGALVLLDAESYDSVADETGFRLRDG